MEARGKYVTTIYGIGGEFGATYGYYPTLAKARQGVRELGDHESNGLIYNAAEFDEARAFADVKPWERPSYLKTPNPIEGVFFSWGIDDSKPPTLHYEKF